MENLAPHTIAWARAEIGQMVQEARNGLRERDAAGNFDGTLCRTLWDEFCWVTQNDGYDLDLSIPGLALGSLQDAYDEAVIATVEEVVDRRLKPVLALLTQHVAQHGSQWEDAPDLNAGDIWKDGVVAEVLEDLKRLAGGRNLEPIGYDRADWLSMELSWRGHFAEVLEDGTDKISLIADFADDLLDEDSDLEPAAKECVRLYMKAAAADLEETVMADFFDIFEKELEPILVNAALRELSDLRDEAVALRDEA